MRPKRILLGAHILMGMGAVEQLALLIHGAPSGVMASDRRVRAATGLFPLAIFSGFTAPLIAQSTRRQNGEIMLAAHAGLGIAGFVLFLAWISNM